MLLRDTSVDKRLRSPLGEAGDIRGDVGGGSAESYLVAILDTFVSSLGASLRGEIGCSG